MHIEATSDRSTLHDEVLPVPEERSLNNRVRTVMSWSNCDQQHAFNVFFQITEFRLNCVTSSRLEPRCLFGNGRFQSSATRYNARGHR